MIEGEYYKKLCSLESDINEHLPTLKNYGNMCNNITEMGVRYGVSTWAFIESKPKKLTCIDIRYDFFSASEKYVKETCNTYGIDFNWITGDSLKIEIDYTDLLMIDTLHTYNQLIGELKKHESKVSKYIILHDTSTFGYIDESIYQHASDFIKNNKTEKFGLMNAVNDFLDSNKNWIIKESFINNNGLTIMERIDKI